MAIRGIAFSGKFSSDRTIQEYCKDIWNIEPVSIPKPTTHANARVKSFANLIVRGEEELTMRSQVEHEEEWNENN